jgi:hypothetical protein
MEQQLVAEGHNIYDHNSLAAVTDMIQMPSIKRGERRNIRE